MHELPRISDTLRFDGALVHELAPLRLLCGAPTYSIFPYDCSLVHQLHDCSVV